jgi:hypothetical protein
MSLEDRKRKVMGEVDTIGRCKQCNGRITRDNRVRGPHGLYCSEACKEMHEEFLERVEEVDADKGVKFSRFGLFFRRLIGKLIVLAILAVFLCALAYFIEIPYLSEFVRGLIQG